MARQERQTLYRARHGFVSLADAHAQIIERLMELRGVEKIEMGADESVIVPSIEVQLEANRTLNDAITDETSPDSQPLTLYSDRPEKPVVEVRHPECIFWGVRRALSPAAQKQRDKRPVFGFTKDFREIYRHVSGEDRNVYENCTLVLADGEFRAWLNRILRDVEPQEEDQRSLRARSHETPLEGSLKKRERRAPQMELALEMMRERWPKGFPAGISGDVIVADMENLFKEKYDDQGRKCPGRSTIREATIKHRDQCDGSGSDES